MIALLLITLILNANALPAQPVTEPDCQVVYWRSEPVLQVQPQVVDGDSGYLGVGLLDLDAEHVRRLKLTGDRGVEIRAVMEGGPADKAGIQPGDVVLTYNGESIMGAQQLSRLVQETPPGHRVKVEYWRDGKVATTLVSVGTVSMGPSRIPQMPGLQFPDVDLPFPMVLWHNPVAGIDYERVDSQLAAYFGVKSGVLVRAVQPGSAADKAGLKAGDVIFSVAQQTFFTDHEISSLFRRHASVSFSVMRDHKRIDLMLNVP